MKNRNRVIVLSIALVIFFGAIGYACKRNPSQPPKKIHGVVVNIRHFNPLYDADIQFDIDTNGDGNLDQMVQTNSTLGAEIVLKCVSTQTTCVEKGNTQAIVPANPKVTLWASLVGEGLDAYYEIDSSSSN